MVLFAISLYVCMGLGYLNQGFFTEDSQKSLISLWIYDGNTNFHLCKSVQEAVNDAVTFNKSVNEGQQGGSADKGTCY